MIFKLRIGRFRFTATFAPVTDVKGVNSLLPDNMHILLWDFDNTALQFVVKELTAVQRTYKLAPIYIVETKKGVLFDDTYEDYARFMALYIAGKLGNYNAYCFKKHDWRKTVEIIAYTQGVDWNYFKWGVFRKRFTLRVTDKEGRKSRRVFILPSMVKEDIAIKDLKSFVQYETMLDHHIPKVIKIG